MKRILSLYFFCVFGFGISQNNLNADINKEVIAKRFELFEKAKQYFEEAEDFSINDSTLAFEKIKKGMNLSPSDPFIKGLGYYYKGRILMDYDLLNAEKTFDQAIENFEKINTAESLNYQSRCWGNQAVIQQNLENHDDYFNILLEKAIPLAQKAGDSLLVAQDFTNIGLAFQNYNENEKAIEYFKKSEAIFLRNDPTDIRQLDNYSLLIRLYLKKNEFNRVESYIEKGLALISENPNNIYSPFFYLSEGMYYRAVKKEIKAFEAYDKGIEVSRALNSQYDLKLLLYERADLLTEQKEWEQSKKILENLLNEGIITDLTDKKKVYGSLAFVEEKLGNFKSAYSWRSKENSVGEDIYDKETKIKIADLESKYKVAQVENEVLTSREKLRKQKSLIFILINFFLLSLLCIWIYFMNKNLRAKHKMETLKQNQKLELSKATIKGEEIERERLSRELHDGLGGMLTGIKLNLHELAEEEDNKNDRKKFEKPLKNLSKAIKSLRKISHNLSSKYLMDNDLNSALKSLCEEMNNKKISVVFDSFHLKPIPSYDVRLTIYRIIQELLTNAVKHSNASEVFVQCSAETDTFFITVEDNGTGFDSEIVDCKGLGLMNIEKRVQLLNGVFTIDSSSNGTNINIEIKINFE